MFEQVSGFSGECVMQLNGQPILSKLRAGTPKNVALMAAFSPLPHKRVNLKVVPLVRVQVGSVTYCQFKIDQIVGVIDTFIQ